MPRHEFTIKSISLAALALAVTCVLPPHAVSEENTVELTHSAEPAGDVSTEGTDWDWNDFDLDRAGTSEESTPRESAEETEWDWDDLGLSDKNAAGTPDTSAGVAIPKSPVSSEPKVTTAPESKSPDTEAGSAELKGTQPASMEKKETEITEAAKQSEEMDEAGAPTEGQDQSAVTSTEVDDWDWDNIEETAAEPVTETTRRTAREDRMAALADKPRPASTAEPNFDAPFEEGYALFQGVGSFQVIPSKKDADMHPCLDCHEWAESDLTPRLLKEPHDNFKLEHGLHGKGEFWCLTCHHLEGDGGLRTLEGLKLSFDEAYILCSQCHSQETKDWYFGAHGKRVENWRGPRQILNCTACHYQHRPELEPRKPMSGPTMRMGMDRPTHWIPKRERGHLPTRGERIWERYAKKRQGPQHE